MQELVEMVRRDHALIHQLVATGSSEETGVLLRAHREFLDATVALLIEELEDDLAADEWQVARGELDRAVELVERDEPADDVRAAVDGHAEQMEQVVLARLLSETDEGALTDRTASAMRLHESLGLGSGRPSAMRAEATTFGDGRAGPAGSTTAPTSD